MKRWEVLEKLILDNGYISFVEVGVWAGETSGYLLEHLDNIWITGIDPYENYDGYNAIGMIEAQELAGKRLDGDMRYKHMHYTSVESAKKFVDKSVDIVFIDANHQLRWITEDLEAWWPKVRKGGILSGHDLTNWSRNKYVRMALGQFAKKYNLKINKEDDTVWWIKKWE